jgi:hypothetical protein
MSSSTLLRSSRRRSLPIAGALVAIHVGSTAKADDPPLLTDAASPSIPSALVAVPAPLPRLDVAALLSNCDLRALDPGGLGAWPRPDDSSKDEPPDNPNLTESFVFNLGTMYINRTTTQASFTRSGGGTGALIDFENTLGLETQEWVAFASARWRITDDWRIEAEYFRFNRSATRTLSKDITWNDQVVTVGTQVHSVFDFSDIRLSTGYSFYKTKDKEFGAALGLHVAEFRTTVSSSTITDDGGTVTAPLPVLDLYGGFAMSEHFAIAFRFDAFKIAWNPYAATLYELGLDLTWNPWRNVGLGIGYRSLQLSGTVHSSSYDGSIDASFSGPVLYATFGF